MNEAVITQRQSALQPTHQQLGATFVDQDGWTVPDSYGDDDKEYAAVRTQGLGLIDLSSRGRIKVSGSEAIMFLNGLITNDMKTLAVNSWMPAIFPTVQGRFVASVRVIRCDNGTNPEFLLETEAVSSATVMKSIERFTLAGDFRVKDVTAETTMLSVQGAKSADVVQRSLGVDVSDFGKSHAVAVDWNGSRTTVLRATHTGEDGFDLIVNNEHAEKLWSTLLGAGAIPVGGRTLETLRIEAGIPRYGRDIDDSNVVTETNLDDAISYTKGCYLGQEIIIRIKHRGHVAKKLSGLVLENQATVQPAEVIKSAEGAEIGRITSTTFSPALQKQIALGYVRYEQTPAGTEVFLNDGTNATVHDLPFVRGSWFSE
jgi:folate-binding protein YgfZ